MFSLAGHDCSTALSEGDLLCPSCRRLVHSEELKRLATAAEEATNSGNLASARDSWSAALKLLPHETVQFSGIEERVRMLDAQVAATSAEHRSTARWKGIAV